MLSEQRAAAAAWPAGVDLTCLHGDRSDWRAKTVLVPAVFREWHGHGPPQHLLAQYPVFLYQRLNASAPCFCANRGYESGVYFKFVAEHYARLPAFVAFIQGDWVFYTKQARGGAFQFWQPSCMGQPGSPWSEYMPLGGRRSVWPPRCVFRQTSWYGKFVGRGRAPVVEACARELLHIMEWPGVVRPYDRARPLNITFYTNMNFVASRARLQRYPHHVYRTLARRFVDDGLCVPGGGGGGGGGGGRDVLAATGVVDVPEIAKYTLGMATELLQQTIFGDVPLEDGPPPVVPQDAQHCGMPAATKCSPA